MDHIELSNEFDVLYNNVISNAAPGLNDYEKSVFLTKAQDELLKSHFNPKGNKYGEGIDDSPKRQIDFSELIKVAKGIISTTPTITFDSRAVVFDLPSNLYIIINEAVYTNTGEKQIIPISYAEYTRLMSKPYKEPFKDQAWRIISTSSDNISTEVIVKRGETISEYIIRYIKRPAPIIVSDIFSEYELTIDGLGTISECELNPIIHPEILQRAVELAKVAYEGDTRSTIELGQRTE